jgi:hypothetical protein
MCGGQPSVSFVTPPNYPAPQVVSWPLATCWCVYVAGIHPNFSAKAISGKYPVSHSLRAAILTRGPEQQGGNYQHQRQWGIFSFPPLIVGHEPWMWSRQTQVPSHQDPKLSWAEGKPCLSGWGWPEHELAETGHLSWRSIGPV